MFEIVPVLQVNERTHWSEAQQCFFASLWFGDLLLNFGTKDRTRLDDAEALNTLGIDIIRECASRLGLADCNELPKHVGGSTGDYAVWIAWEDFIPACCAFARHRVVIPTAAKDTTT